MMRNLVALNRVVGMKQVTINRIVNMSILMMVKRAHQKIRNSVAVSITVVEEVLVIMIIVALNKVVMMKNKATLSRAVSMSIVAPNKTVTMGTAYIQLVMIVKEKNPMKVGMRVMRNITVFNKFMK